MKPPTFLFFASAALFLTLSACKPKEEAAGPMGPGEKETTAKTLETLLTEEDIRAEFSDAGMIDKEVSAGMWPSINYRFSSGGEKVTLGFTGVLGEASPEMFEASKEAISKNTVVPAKGIGDQAFYTEHPVNQLSVRKDANLFHLALRKGNGGDREKAEALMKRVLEK